MSRADSGGESASSTTDRLERIVDTALDPELVSWDRPSAGSVADTYRLDLAGSPAQAVCKLGGASVWSDEVIEPAALRLVRDRTDLPVPTVLASGSLRGTPPDVPSRWALYSFCEGQPLHAAGSTLDPATRLHLIEAAGALLGRLHSALPAEAVGALSRSGDGGTEPFGPSSGSLRVREPVGWHAIEPAAESPLGTLPVALGDDVDGRPVFTHGDFQPSNLLVEDGHVSAVLDWGNANLTLATYALARAEVRFVDLWGVPDRPRRSVHRHFRRAYARAGPDLPDDLDRRMRWYKAIWVAQSVANYGRLLGDDRGRQQVARQVRRLFARGPLR